MILLRSRLQVLALALLSLRVAHAQPPDLTTEPAQVPLLSMTPEEFEAAHGGLSRLKLKMENATAAEVAAEVSRQIGMPIDVSYRFNKPTLRYSVEADGQPMWQAVRQWNRGANPLSLEFNNNGASKWDLAPGSMEAGRAVQAGPFEVLATGAIVSHVRSVEFGVPDAEPGASNALDIPLKMRVDHRLQHAFSALIVQVESAVDDQGRALVPGDNVVAPQWSDYQGHIEVPLHLPAPAAGAKSLNVRGLLRIATAFKGEAWEIDPVATPRAEKKWRQGDEEIAYVFDGLKADEGSWTAQFHIVRTFAGPRRVFKSNAPWSQSLLGGHDELMHSVHFFDAGGQKMIEGGGGGPSSVEGNRIKSDFSIAAYRPRKSPGYDNAPAKIVVDVPLEWREVQFPFEFRGLPLPPP